jgi:hypothetical protein
MEGSTAALLGAVVGALTTLAVTVVTFLFQGSREKRQARAKNVARVAQCLATLQVCMDWIIWLGEHQPQHLTDDEIKNYAENVMPRLAELLGAVALIGGYNAALYDRFLAFYHRALELDEHINARLEDQGSQWTELSEQARRYFREWVEEIRRTLRHLCL